MPRNPPSSPISPVVPARRLRCFACGCEYSYLGDRHHPGTCPACSARGVSPAGELRVDGDPTAFGTGTGDETYRIDAADHTERAFHYWIAPVDDGRRARLVRIRVADTVVGPGHDAWPDRLGELVPERLEQAADRADLRLVAPESIVE